MAAKQFTLTNTGTRGLIIQSVTFNNPVGIGHTANLANLGGSSTEIGNALLSYNFDSRTVQTFTVDYYDAGAGAGRYVGNIVIGGSNGTSQTIASAILITNPPTTTTTSTSTSTSTSTTSTSTTTTTSAPTSTTTTTAAPGTTTTTTSAPTSTTTTTLAPGLTTTTTTQAPTSTTTTTSAPTSTTTTTLAPGLTTTTTTAAPTTTSTTSTSTSTTSTSTSTTSTSTSTTSTSTTTAAPTTTTTTTTAGGGPLANPGFGGYYIFVKSTSGNASLTLRLDDDGGWRIIQASTGLQPAVSGALTRWTPPITGNWYSPTTSGIGSGYLYRLTVDGISTNGTGTVTPNVLGPGSWLPFTGAAAGSVAINVISAPSGNEAVGDFTVEIAVNNGGLPGTIVSTTTFTYNGSDGS